ncbi:MAG: FAD-containing monooxygenase EthA [Oleiphilus sp.]|nr:MAG: FAD-containing monooxygenase EthA [Oleiphilus sp.]
MTAQHFDVIIVGAGLSGIGSACHIARECPDKSLAILERRERMGGTWDLFRYPGIRSDSDMTSFGFNFKPWFSEKVLAKGPDIRQYVVDTAEEYGIKDKVHFGLKITNADWNSQQQLWTLTATHEPSGQTQTFTCNFFNNCTGYFNYDKGYQPEFEGTEDFKGQIVHPQYWPEDLDYSGKKVAIIGSGATAVTLLPAMAKTAAHVTMLQRSPTYIMALPDTDKIAMLMEKFLPKSWVFKITRKRNILIQRGIYLASMRWPNLMRRFFLKQASKQLDSASDMRNFTPNYSPWEQRLCAAPDGDFFESLKAGNASVMTDRIERFTEQGIVTISGKTIDADIVVTATGLELQMMGGLEMRIDGKLTQLSEKMTYKSIMIQDIPNFTWIFGYTNAPWTLKCDIAGRYLCRLIKHMDANNLKVATPKDLYSNGVDTGVLDDFTPGYIQRAKHLMPRQGKSGPWKIEMHYGKDKKMLLDGPIVDGVMHFDGAIASTSEIEANTLSPAA